MELEELCRPIRVVCPICFKVLTGFKNERGAVNVRCKYCGSGVYSTYKNGKTTVTGDPLKNIKTK